MLHLLGQQLHSKKSNTKIRIVTVFSEILQQFKVFTFRELGNRVLNVFIAQKTPMQYFLGFFASPKSQWKKWKKLAYYLNMACKSEKSRKFVVLARLINTFWLLLGLKSCSMKFITLNLCEKVVF